MVDSNKLSESLIHPPKLFDLQSLPRAQKLLCGGAGEGDERRWSVRTSEHPAYDVKGMLDKSLINGRLKSTHERYPSRYQSGGIFVFFLIISQ